MRSKLFSNCARAQHLELTTVTREPQELAEFVRQHPTIRVQDLPDQLLCHFMSLRHHFRQA